jgi:hypothetical protein
MNIVLLLTTFHRAQFVSKQAEGASARIWSVQQFEDPRFERESIDGIDIANRIALQFGNEMILCCSLFLVYCCYLLFIIPNFHSNSTNCCARTTLLRSYPQKLDD